MTAVSFLTAQTNRCIVSDVLDYREEGKEAVAMSIYPSVTARPHGVAFLTRTQPTDTHAEDEN